MPETSIPLSVVGGYLGAGKTTVLNCLLAEPAGRRIGVVVNDFGELGIDVDRLRAADVDAPAGVVSLTNGCVCCTLGSDLLDALQSLTSLAEPPDHVVVEVSGVADPSTAAAWGTVPPFVPGGVIVLAAADDVIERSHDRYVGGEVVRQLRGADLVVVTKADLVAAGRRDAVVRWCDEASGGAPVVVASFGDLPADLVLGERPGRRPVPGSRGAVREFDHGPDYRTWAWEGGGVPHRAMLDDFLDCLPRGVLRLKGSVLVGRAAVDPGVGDVSGPGPESGARWLTVDVVGRRRDVRPGTPGDRSRLVAIGTPDGVSALRGPGRHEPRPCPV